MKNRTKFLIFATLVLGGIYIYGFTDWFSEKNIRIKFRSLGRIQGNGKTAEPITFFLDREYRLTSVKVISLDDAATNKYPHALWHLIAASNSAPVPDFLYGENVPGMKPKIAGTTPEPLEPSKNYRIFLETATMKGEKDFQPRAKSGK